MILTKEKTKGHFKIVTLILRVIKSSRQLPYRRNRHLWIPHAEPKLKSVEGTFHVLKNVHKFTYQSDLNLFLAVEYLCATKQRILIESSRSKIKLAIQLFWYYRLRDSVIAVLVFNGEPFLTT